MQILISLSIMMIEIFVLKFKIFKNGNNITVYSIFSISKPHPTQRKMFNFIVLFCFLTFQSFLPVRKYTFYLDKEEEDDRKSRQRLEEKLQGIKFQIFFFNNPIKSCFRIINALFKFKHARQ